MTNDQQAQAGALHRPRHVQLRPVSSGRRQHMMGSSSAPLLTRQCGPTPCRYSRRPAGSSCSMCSVWLPSCSGAGRVANRAACEACGRRMGHCATSSCLQTGQPAHPRACHTTPHHTTRVFDTHPQHKQQVTAQVHPLVAPQLHIVALQRPAVHHAPALQLHLRPGGRAGGGANRRSAARPCMCLALHSTDGKQADSSLPMRYHSTRWKVVASSSGTRAAAPCASAGGARSGVAVATSTKRPCATASKGAVAAARHQLALQPSAGLEKQAQQ